MRDIFLGDLSRLKLFDILKALLVEKKTGLLAIQGRDLGEIYLDRGNIVHSRAPGVSGEEAFLIITEWGQGKALFKPEVSTRERTISIPAEQLLLKWSYRKQEWDKMKEVVPSSDIYFRLAQQKGSEDRSIRPDEWNILALANGMRSVSEIAKAIGWSEFKTTRTLYQLVRTGLLERGEDQKLPKRRRLGENFFATLENEFKQIMGPVAPFIIEDKIAEFGEDKGSFPQDQGVPFIESLSEEIAEESRRKEFVKVMTEVLATER
jgi:DNA-binding MarR family transcriptional regulator